MPEYMRYFPTYQEYLVENGDMEYEGDPIPEDQDLKMQYFEYVLHYCVDEIIEYQEETFTDADIFRILDALRRA